MAEVSLAGWTRTFAADGILFVPPRGPREGSVRIRTRIRPFLKASEMLRLMREQIPATYPDVVVAPMTRLITQESEYALVLSLIASGSQGARALQRTVAMVLGDDSFDSIDAVSTVPADFEGFRHVVESLAYNYSLGLGEKRRRRYFYTPPAGWIGIARPRSTYWIPPGFPKHRSSITVYDARPATLTPAAVQDRTLWEDLSGAFRTAERKPTFDITTPKNVLGRVMILTGGYPGGAEEVIHNVALHDAQYVYSIRLESSPERVDADRAALGTIIESVESIQPPKTMTSLIEWSDVMPE